MIFNLQTIRALILPLSFAISKFSSISLRTWKIAREIFAATVTRVQSLSRMPRAKEGGCEHFVDQQIVSVWQKSLGFSNAADRLGLEQSLQLLRSDAIGNDIKNKPFENLFDNQNLAPLLTAIAKDQLSLNPETDLRDLDGLERAYRRLYRLYGDASSPLNRPFDPLLFGNLPYFWRTLEFDGYAASLIRMPAATRDVGNTFEITSEFQGYISALSRKKKCHLYVNLMDKIHGNEAGRSRALQQWATASPPGLALASLDKNSAFYLSGGCYRKTSLHLVELRNLTKLWLANAKLHQWPFDFSDLDVRIQKAQKLVEETLAFSPNQTVERATCRIYLDLLQTELLHQLLHNIKPASVNISCKNCIDRGPCQQVLLTSWLDLNQGKPLFDISKALLMLLPPWLVSGRAMQFKRFERCLSVLRTLSQIQ